MDIQFKKVEKLEVRLRVYEKKNNHISHIGQSKEENRKLKNQSLPLKRGKKIGCTAAARQKTFSFYTI